LKTPKKLYAPSTALTTYRHTRTQRHTRHTRTRTHTHTHYTYKDLHKQKLHTHTKRKVKMAAMANANTEKTFVICKIPQNSDSHVFFNACYTGGKKEYHEVSPTYVFGGHFKHTSRQVLHFRRVKFKKKSDFRALLKRPGALYDKKELKSGELNAKGWVLQISLLCDEDGLLKGLRQNLLYPAFVGDLYVVKFFLHQDTGAIVPESFHSEMEAEAQMDDFFLIHEGLKLQSHTAEVMKLEESPPNKKCTEVQVKISAFRDGSGNLSLVFVELNGEEAAMNCVKEELKEFTWHGCKGMLLDNFPKAWMEKKLLVDSFNVLLQSIYHQVKDAAKVEGLTSIDAHEAWQQELRQIELAPERNKVFIYKNSFEATLRAHVEVF